MTLPVNIIINGISYTTADLPEEAKISIFNLLVANQHITRLEQELAIAKTAKNVYEKVLVNTLEVNSKPQKKKKIEKKVSKST